MFEQFAAILIAIHAGLIRQFINKALNEKAMLRMIDGSPRPEPDMMVDMRIMDQLIVNLVRDMRGLWRIMLLGKQIVPGNRHAVFVQTRPETTDRGRAIPVLLCVLFPRPDHLDRMIELAGNLDRHQGIVRV